MLISMVLRDQAQRQDSHTLGCPVRPKKTRDVVGLGPHQGPSA